MMRNSLSLSHWAVALLLVLAVAASLAWSQTPLGVAPQQGVLLLRNGRTLTGKITREGDAYFVALSNGEIRVRAADVEMVGRDLDECYFQKRTRMLSGDVNEHMDLAQWCVDVGLLGAAARELAVAINLEPRHPRLKLLQRRLELARQKPNEDAPAAAASTSGDLITAEELDRLTNALPQRVVETFTTSVQPLLHNHCTTAGCHGPGGKSSFRLLRLSARGTPSRRLTQRNLYAALQVVNREKPDESPLLTRPIKPHGGSETAVFNNRDLDQYRLLMAWVQDVAGAPPSAREPLSVAANQPPLRQNVAGGAAGQADTAASGIRAQTTSGAQSPEQQARQADFQAQLLGPQPRDPFDAEVFNRRYFKDRPREQPAPESESQEPKSQEPSTLPPLPTEDSPSGSSEPVSPKEQ